MPQTLYFRTAQCWSATLLCSTRLSEPAPGCGPACAANGVFGEQDPGFVNAAKGDYHLKPDAVLFATVGFRPIPVDEIGLYQETKGVTHVLATCSYWPEEGAKSVSFPCLFAEYAKGYKTRYKLDDTEFERMLATVSALAYRNGVDNPLAQFGKGGPPDKQKLFTADAILNLPPDKNPMIADPLRLHDCSLVTDGSAAVVIMKTRDALTAGKKVVEIAGIGHVNERLPVSVRPNMYDLMAGKEAVRRAFTEAKIAISDVDLAEVHDCFTINQLLCTEALGLSKDSRAGHDYLEGRFTRSDDTCSVNLSGGLKAKGHPVGATGVSMHALIYKQLVGEPIGATRSKKTPAMGVAFNVGGSAVTNCVSVLRRLK